MFIGIMSTLSERLKQARQYAGLTQEELSAKSGVTQASISKIELGKNKSENTTFGVQLAVACGVRCEWLVLGMGEMLEGLKPDGAACYEYRAKNSYGATFPSAAVLTTKGKMLLKEHDGNTFVNAWNKACTPPGGDEIASFVTSRVLK